jgi:hypothetical protein
MALIRCVISRRQTGNVALGGQPATNIRPRRDVRALAQK